MREKRISRQNLYLKHRFVLLVCYDDSTVLAARCYSKHPRKPRSQVHRRLCFDPPPPHPKKKKKKEIAAYENIPSEICAQRRLKSAGEFAQPDLNLRSAHISKVRFLIATQYFRVSLGSDYISKPEVCKPVETQIIHSITLSLMRICTVYHEINNSQ